MCGIIGHIGQKDCVSLLVEGLRRLEYRGYDSAGVAVVSEGIIEVRRCEGKLGQLEALLQEQPVSGAVGIGHTRWATHGPPSDINAHPHKVGSIAVVHNGIIENYLPLKKQLLEMGCHINSETDTEIVAQLINNEIQAGSSFEEAVTESLRVIEGSYALVILNEREPDKLIAVRKESPLVLGLSSDAFLVASDIPAILGHTREVIFLDDGEMVILTGDSLQIRGEDGKTREKEVSHISWNPVMAEKAGYTHFMEKEIYEQPRAVIDTFRGRISESSGEVFLDDLNLEDDFIQSMDKIVIVACGTSYHAGLVGKFMLESLCGMPVEVDLGSEFRYRDPIITSNTLQILISQSGETADTLAGLREGRKKGAFLLAVVNVVGSSLVRHSDGVLYTHAGPEIGVASTKAFTTQLVALYLLALYLGVKRGRVTLAESQEFILELVKLPKKMETALGEDERIRAIAREYANARDFLYLGRGVNYPIALEGALKLKEISYIHAEGYAAGEMKHGPIALIDEHMPVVAVVSRGLTFDKMLSNIKEVKARGAHVVAIAQHGHEEIAKVADEVLWIPRTLDVLAPILSVVPMQLFAYYVSLARGNDVDKPRNLAKSVTVE